MSKFLGRLAGAVKVCAIAVLLILAAAYGLAVSHPVALKPWHLLHLDAEFRATDIGRIASLENYLKNEEKLFTQLSTLIYDKGPRGDFQDISRYISGGRADPRRLLPDWNRTVELPQSKPIGTALLLHGLTDSPYAMRGLAERLHARGYWVVVLRLPGHGTVPSGLIHAHWQDWASAVRLAAAHVKTKAKPEAPFVIGGFSTGAALAVEYALSRLKGEDVPAPSGLILLSPAIGVSSLAAAARWGATLSTMPGLAGLAWSDVDLEYDPYKYVSFPIHAADQIYRLTQRIQLLIDSLDTGAGVRAMPPILAFQSVADATVSTQAVIGSLMRRLGPDGHQLVLFDINRNSGTQQFLLPAALAVKENLLTGQALPFGLTVLTNVDADSAALIAARKRAQSQEVTREATGLTWPQGMFSLSHVALPFTPQDPVYGAVRPGLQATVYLGRIELRGEKGLLAASSEVLLRLRYNPFFSFVSVRIDEFIDQLSRT